MYVSCPWLRLYIMAPYSNNTDIFHTNIDISINLNISIELMLIFLDVVGPSISWSLFQDNIILKILSFLILLSSQNCLTSYLNIYFYFLLYLVIHIINKNLNKRYFDIRWNILKLIFFFPPVLILDLFLSAFKEKNIFGSQIRWYMYIWNVLCETHFVCPVTLPFRPIRWRIKKNYDTN